MSTIHMPPHPEPPKPLPGAAPYYDHVKRAWFILTDCGPMRIVAPKKSNEEGGV